MAPIPIVKVGHIDDVQELIKTKSKIPERFMRDHITNHHVNVDDHHDSPKSIDIPIIDLSKLSSKHNKDDFNAELLRLSNACQEWGFFQVINHGIELSLVEKMEELTNEFFMLPVEEKQKYPMAPGTIQGYGQAFVFSEDQKLDWCNMLALGVIPDSIRVPKLWPTNPPQYGETLEAYSIGVRKLCQELLRHIASTLGLNEEYFNEMFKVAVQAVRMNYYPPCPRPDLVFGLSPHSDGSALTVLQERRGSSAGLQILKDNKWIYVQPIPNALIINVGDTIEVLTNGKYKSIEHRAVTDEKRDRLSLVTFYAPSYEIELGPIPELVGEGNSCKYKTYNHGEYSKHYVTNKLQGKKTLEFAKINQDNNNNSK